MVLLLLWPTLILPPTRIPVALLLIIALMPLLLPLFGVLHRNPRALIWTAFISLLYFIHGCMDAWATEGISRWLAGSEAVLSAILFFSASFAARSNESESD